MPYALAIRIKVSYIPYLKGIHAKELAPLSLCNSYTFISLWDIPYIFFSMNHAYAFHKHNN